MVNKNEIRPGSYVQNDIGYIFQLESHGHIADMLDEENSTRVEMFPIPLSSDVLLKFPFEERTYVLGNKVYCYPEDKLLLRWSEKQGVEIMFNASYDSEWEPVVNCDSLHRLQNLILALTGEGIEPDRPFNK